MKKAPRKPTAIAILSNFNGFDKSMGAHERVAAAGDVMGLIRRRNYIISSNVDGSETIRVREAAIAAVVAAYQRIGIQDAAIITAEWDLAVYAREKVPYHREIRGYLDRDQG